DIERRMRVLVKGPVGPPGCQRPSRPPVFVVGVVALLIGRKGEPDGVQGIPSEQALVLVRPDDVIGWRDDEAEVRNGRAVVAKSAERTDLGHGTSRTGTRHRE